MRLPNGMGSVHKLPGKRRKPWRVRVTAGWVSIDAEGREVADRDPSAVDLRQKYYTVGYYATRKDALTALANFQGIPQEQQETPTFGEVYARWWEQHSPTISEATQKRYEKSRKWLSGLMPIKMDTLTVEQLDNYFRTLNASDGVKAFASWLAKLVLKYALKKGIIESDLAARMDTITKPATQIHREVFSHDEVEALWTDPSRYAKVALIALYGGWRPAEVLSLTPSQIDLQEQTITAGSKTAAGKGRVVPIHPRILPLVTELVNAGGPCLFPFGYDAYLVYFRSLGHLPHDTRHSFATAAKDCGMDPTIRKRILGHQVTDITESVYTHATAGRFKEEIAKLKY